MSILVSPVGGSVQAPSVRLNLEMDARQVWEYINLTHRSIPLAQGNISDADEGHEYMGDTSPVTA